MEGGKREGGKKKGRKEGGGGREEGGREEKRREKGRREKGGVREKGKEGEKKGGNKAHVEYPSPEVPFFPGSWLELQVVPAAALYSQGLARLNPLKHKGCLCHKVV